MPTDDGRRPEYRQLTSPALIQAPNQQPEQLVIIAECEPGTSAKGDLKLLAEQQVFDDEMPPAAEAPQESAEQEWKQIKHQLSIADQLPCHEYPTFAVPRPKT